MARKVQKLKKRLNNNQNRIDMKKIFLVLALSASFTMAYAQQLKNVQSALKKVESVKEDTANPKKSVKPATWIDLGDAFVDVYGKAIGDGWVTASEADLAIVMSKVQPKGVETVSLSGQPFTVKHYETADYYFNQNGVLAMMYVTVKDAASYLTSAVDAYSKAASLDEKGKKSKVLSANLNTVNGKLSDLAVAEYRFGNLETASEIFEAAVNAAAAAPLCQVDTNSLYNAGLTAWMTNQNERARGLFEKCRDLQYYGEDGDLFAKLADIASKEGDKEASLKYLEDGFVTFPKSQSILVGLINYYVSAGTGTDRLFELLNTAKANEPNNASLWYVEGNIRLKLDPPQVNEAIAAYDKCAEIDPNYVYGFIGKAQYYASRSDQLVEMSNVLGNTPADIQKYDEYMAERKSCLKNCIANFETAFDKTGDVSLKKDLADVLKRICFLIREEPGYQEKHDQYDAYINAN